MNNFGNIKVVSSLLPHPLLQTCNYFTTTCLYSAEVYRGCVSEHPDLFENILGYALLCVCKAAHNQQYFLMLILACAL